jgi:sugar lactone lactonase YvrE
MSLRLMPSSHLTSYFSFNRVIRRLNRRKGLQLFCAIVVAVGVNWFIVSAEANAATTTTLAVTAGGVQATTVASGAVVTLTATVQAAGSPVTVGQVNFCDASAAHCTDIHILGTAQLTSAGTATLKFRPGIGSHSYKGVFLGTNNNSGSASSPSALEVTGTPGALASTTAISETGSWGNYALTATVTETGNTAPPTGAVSFLNTTNGNAAIGTGTLGSATRGVAWTSVSTNAPSLAGVSYAVADLNGDGISDLFVEDYFGTYDVFLGNGDGTFTEKGSAFGPYSETGGFIVGDFNNDGIPDVAAINASYNAPNNTITIFLGNGDGTFTVAGSSPALGSNPSAIATADINGDGNTDLIVVQQSSSSSSGGEVVIFFGNGEGTFTQAPSTTPLPSVVSSVIPADLNGDGHVDLVLSGVGASSVTVLLGKGDGTFNSLAGPSQAGGAAVAVADLNNDGFPDLVCGAATTSYLTVFLGNGDGTFTETPSSPNASLLVGNPLVIADINQDGIPDLVYTYETTTGVLFGKGDGTFVQFPTTLTFDTDGFGTPFVVADFNGDGWPDVLAIDGSGRTITDSLTQPTETATASATVSIAASGPHLADASYPGDPNYDASTSGTVSLLGIPPGTTTTLTMTSGGASATSVAQGTVILLTATVNAGVSPVTSGQVTFCDASTSECTDIHLLGTGALTSAGTATFKFVPGPGTHSYKAEFVQNGFGLTSSSTVLTLTVGPAPKPVYSDSTTITASGTPGAYSLTATVLGIGGPAVPTGTVSFLDTSFGNTALATATLGPGIAQANWLFSQTPAATAVPTFQVTGDFNGDGIPDLALIGTNTSTDTAVVTILFGKGDGTFTLGPTTQTELSTSYTPVVMVTGDFNGDGKTDLVLLSYSFVIAGDSVTTLLGDGDGTFTASAPSQVYIQSPTGGDFIGGSIVAADFNGDGKLDLAVIGDDVSSSEVTILLGKGDGTFTAVGSNFGTNQTFESIATGDFNGDGIPDLVMGAYANSGGATVLLGKGDGTFTVAGSMSFGTGSGAPESIIVGDFNGDGKLDVVLGNYDGVVAYLGNGDGTFNQVQNSSNTGGNTSLVAGDFNHDGKLDLAGLSNSGGLINLYLGGGDGTFTLITPQVSQTPTYPASILAADFNGDGVTDLAMLTRVSDTASILLTEPAETATATVNGIAPVGAGTHNVDASYAGDSNYAASVSATTPLTAAVAAPVISPDSGTFTSRQSITITDATPGATIYYSTSGEFNYIQYTAPIPLEGSGTLTISAYATATGYQQSQNASATYTLNFSPAATPVLSLASGYYAGQQTLTLTDSTPGATIYYSTNGTYPYTYSNVYSGPITVSNSEVVSAIAVAPGYGFSSYATGQYFIGSSSSRFIYTIAGSYTWGYSGDGGPATFAELSNLAGVAVDGSGNVYMSDSADNVVRKIAAGTGIITTIAGTGAAAHTGDNGAAASAALWTPTALAVDGSGNLFIAETGDSVIRRIDAVTGNITTFAGSPTPTGSIGGPAANFGLYGIAGIACDTAGDLYIAESEDVVEVSVGTGNITEIAGLTTGAGFGILNGIAFGDGQNIFVSDSGYSVVWKINRGVASVFAGSLYGASGGDGGPATSAGLYFPAGVAVDGMGNVYIADDFDLAIREVNTSGIINTVAGILHVESSAGGDGSPATDVGLAYPQVIASDSAGNIYFAEQDTNRIRKISAPIAPPSSVAATPAFSLAAGTYSGSQTLTMTDTTPGAEIYVSLNGSAPTTAGQGYHGPINITGSVTVKAIAIAPGYLSSAPISATYTITTAPAAVISTFAGNDKFGFSPGGGPVSSTSIGDPEVVAFDGAGDMYIADAGNYVVWMVSASTHKISIVAGTGTFGSGTDGVQATTCELGTVNGLAVDELGNLYIADTGSGRVRMVSSQTGIITTIAGPGVPNVLGDGGPATSAYLGGPLGIAFDKAGNLYLAGGNTGRVRMIAAGTGIISTVAGGGTQAQLGDGGLATAAYVPNPIDIALDAAGNLYINDNQTSRIRKVTASTGIITTIAGNGTAGSTGDGGVATAAEIVVAQGIAIDSHGNVYFSTSPNIVRRVDATTNIITTFAGDTYFGYGGDGGAASMAELSNPQGLAFDGSGNLYISDFGNLAVRKLTFPGAAAAPVFSPASGTYHSTQTVTISDTTPGATIYYTIDGSTPTPASAVYSAAITVSATETLQAIAVAAGYTESAVASAQYTINPKIAPVITWPTPAAILYGAALNSIQLNATANVAGTFVYSPSGGTVLGAGTQTLSVTFTPTDSADYATATASVSLTVNKATPSVVVAPGESSIPTNQALSVTVTVSASGSGLTPSGTVVLSGGGYNSAATTLSGGSATINIPGGSLSIGSDTLSVTYTTDASSSSNYDNSSGSAPVAVTAAAKLSSSVTIGSATTPITNTQTDTITVTATGASGQSAPTGTITLASGTYSAQQTLSSGAASFTIPAGALASGTNTVTATYSGDSTYAGSTTTTVVTVSALIVAAPTPAGVTPGSTANSTVTFTAGSNYSGTMNVSCSLTTSPSGAVSLPTCSLNPASVSITAGGTGTTAFTANTTAASSAQLTPANQNLWRLGGGTVLAGVLMLWKPRRRRRCLSILIVLFSIFTAGVIACGGGGGGGSSTGGGGGSGSGTPATTAGNYVFTVTGTDSLNATITASTTITVTVE